MTENALHIFNPVAQNIASDVAGKAATMVLGKNPSLKDLDGLNRRYGESDQLKKLHNEACIIMGLNPESDLSDGTQEHPLENRSLANHLYEDTFNHKRNQKLSVKDKIRKNAKLYAESIASAAKNEVTGLFQSANQTDPDTAYQRTYQNAYRKYLDTHQALANLVE